jgi:hypothetical protein
MSSAEILFDAFQVALEAEGFDKYASDDLLDEISAADFLEATDPVIDAWAEAEEEDDDGDIDLSQISAADFLEALDEEEELEKEAGARRMLRRMSPVHQFRYGKNTLKALGTKYSTKAEMVDPKMEIIRRRARRRMQASVAAPSGAAAAAGGYALKRRRKKNRRR